MKTLIAALIVFSPVIAGLAIYWAARLGASALFRLIARRYRQDLEKFARAMRKLIDKRFVTL